MIRTLRSVSFVRNCLVPDPNLAEDAVCSGPFLNAGRRAACGEHSGMTGQETRGETNTVL